MCIRDRAHTVLRAAVDQILRRGQQGPHAWALENETKRLHYGTVYAAPGSGESTTDKSYSGLCLSLIHI